MRGHDNAVEVVAFAPVAAYPSIRELAGLAVRLPQLFGRRLFDLPQSSLDGGEVEAARRVHCDRRTRQGRQDLGHVHRAGATYIGELLIIMPRGFQIGCPAGRSR